MVGSLTVRCDKCHQSTVVEIHLDRKFNVQNRQRMIDALNAKGWSTGRDCLCPACIEIAKKNESRCEKCMHRVSSKEGYIGCCVDGEYICAWDTCHNFTPIRDKQKSKVRKTSWI